MGMSTDGLSIVQPNWNTSLSKAMWLRCSLWRGCAITIYANIE